MSKDTKTASEFARATMKHVAIDAGVSVSAVSKVLRDAYGVSPALRANVEASMARLNYRPLASARAMRGHSYTIGVLLTDIANPFYPEILGGITEGFDGTGYQTLIGIGRASQYIEIALARAMIDRQMDGVIMIGQRMGGAALEEVARSVPTVLIGHQEPAATAFDTVNNNDYEGGKLVVKHLLAQGFQRPAMISLELPEISKMDISYQREQGYRDAMQAACLGSAIRVERMDDTFGLKSDLLDAKVGLRLSQPNPPDAIFAWVDIFAFDILSALQKAGRPDVGVIGYGNSSLCSFMNNDMSSVDQCGKTLGREAARMLLGRIAGRTVSERYVSMPTIAARKSTNLRSHRNWEATASSGGSE